MAFDGSTVTNLTIVESGVDLVLRWESSEPAGTRFQVYLDRTLSWIGLGRSAVLPKPVGTGNRQIDVGSVGPGESRTDFGSTLPATLAGNRAYLTWIGGTFLDEEIEGFHIYRSTVAGGSVSYTTPVDSVPAYPGGIIMDGYGMGGYGMGGYGREASDYQWTSPPLGNGVWRFGIKAYNASGNEAASGVEVAVTITTAPQPPAANSARKRLTFTYNAGTQVATLNWLASPG